MSKKQTICLLVIFLVVRTSYCQAPSPKPAAESFVHKLLRITGIASNPSTLKGPGDEVTAGQIWIAEPERKDIHKLTNSGGYRSPIFMPGDKRILALEGSSLVILSVNAPHPSKIPASGAITKLVGISQDDPDKVLVLTSSGAAHPGVGLLSLSSGNITPLAYDPGSSEDRHMIEHLQAWKRVYGDKSVFVQRETKTGVAGTEEWTDVYLQTKNNTVNVSQCDGDNCGQPSLSFDSQKVVFVKRVEE